MCCFRWCGRQLCLRHMPISGVNSTPRPTAVYASDPASPRRPQDSLPSCLLGFGRTRLALASSLQLPYRTPHTALQSVVSSSRLSRRKPGRVKREQPGFREEGIWPALMVGAADAPPGALFLLAQDGAQPSPDKPVELVESGVMGMFEVAEPAAQQWIEVSDGAGEAVAPCAPRLLSYAVLELVQALLAHVTLAGFETVAEELEPLPRLPAV